VGDGIDTLDRLVERAIVGEVADDDEVDLVAVFRICARSSACLPMPLAGQKGENDGHFSSQASACS
jgi:hypothetical protein